MEKLENNVSIQEELSKQEQNMLKEIFHIGVLIGFTFSRKRKGFPQFVYYGEKYF